MASASFFKSQRQKEAGADAPRRASGEQSKERGTQSEISGLPLRPLLLIPNSNRMHWRSVSRPLFLTLQTPFHLNYAFRSQLKHELSHRRQQQLPLALD